MRFGVHSLTVLIAYSILRLPVTGRTGFPVRPVRLSTLATGCTWRDCGRLRTRLFAALGVRLPHTIPAAVRLCFPLVWL